MTEPAAPGSSLSATLHRWDGSKAVLFACALLVLGHVLALTNVFDMPEIRGVEFNWISSFKQAAPAEMCRDDETRSSLLSELGRSLAPVSGSILRAPRALSDWGKAGAIIDRLVDTPCLGTMELRSVIDVVKNAPINLAYGWLLSIGPASVMIPALFSALVLFRIAGCLAVFLVARRISRSNACALGSYCLFALLLPEPPLAANVVLTLYLALLAASRWPWTQRLPAWSGFTAQGLFLALFGLQALLSLFQPNPVHSVIASLALGLGLCVALFMRDRRVLVRILLCGACLVLVMRPFQHYGQKVFSNLTRAEVAKKELGLPMAFFHGTGERPNPYGYIATDTGGQIQLLKDVYLQLNSPTLVAFQGYNRVSVELLRDSLSRHPFTHAYTLWKRLIVCIDLAGDFPPSKAFPGIWASYLRAALWGTCLIFVLSLACLPLLPELLLTSGVILWEALGLHVLCGWLHSTDDYSLLGEVLAAALFPCMLIHLFACRKTLFERRGKAIGLASIVMACLLAVTLLPGARRDIEKERLFTSLADILTHRAIIDIDAADPARMREIFDSIAAIGGEEPGELAMFAAWYYHHLVAWRHESPWYVTYSNESNKPRIEAYRAEGLRLKLEAYASALKASPDNPYFPAYAKILGIPGWEDIFREAIRRHPDAMLSPMMAGELLKSDRLSPEERITFQAFLDKAMGENLRGTADVRPGYRFRPGVESGEGIRVSESPEGLEVRLEPGKAAVLEPFRTFGTPEIVAGVYARVLSGEASASLRTGGGPPCPDEPQELRPGDATGYRRLVCSPPGEKTSEARVVITAKNDGAVLILRDLYPLIARPRVAASP